MPSVRSDRRLCVTADRSELVEETDPRAAFLLVQEGGWIGEGDVVRYGVRLDDEERVVIDGPPEAKAQAAPENKMVSAPEDKAADEEGEDVERQDPSDSRQWTLKMSPEDYLARFPDGPNAELARQYVSDDADPAP